MNFDRGMRRLAIFAGILGAVAGARHSYTVLRDVPSERYQHKVFQTLEASEVVKQARARVLAANELPGVPSGATVEPISEMGESATDVNSDRIKTIFWNHDLSVNFFVMRDGGYVLSRPAPSAWLYLLWTVFPALGFFILWGAIRTIAWVVAGFAQPDK